MTPKGSVELRYSWLDFSSFRGHSLIPQIILQHLRCSRGSLHTKWGPNRSSLPSELEHFPLLIWFYQFTVFIVLVFLWSEFLRTAIYLGWIRWKGLAAHLLKGPRQGVGWQGELAEDQGWWQKLHMWTFLEDKTEVGEGAEVKNVGWGRQTAGPLQSPCLA